MTGAVLSLRGVQKNYSGLRPLRIRDLTIARGERVAVSGFDAASAELLVNLVTGATLPDEGDVRVLGQRTADIATGDEWLASLDRFGIASARAVMMEGATLAQNLAMPFTLDIEPIPSDIRAKVDALAEECGIDRTEGWLDRPAGDAPPDVRMRGHVARAVSLAPQLLILEHPTATLSEPLRVRFADDVVRVAERRSLASLVITQDAAFAARVAHRTLVLNGATGDLAPLRKKWFW